jgi:uncharacterized repeat protein (TIGR03803 family)
LVIDDKGDLFGTTNNGGALGVGTVFKVAADTHALRTLTTFNNMNGANPYAGLILGTDGNLYGTTASGGTNNMGTVFTVSNDSFYAFGNVVNFNGSSGAAPYGSLITDSSGNLYGTTFYGGDLA